MRKRQSQSKSTGFTLIEVMLVIVLIGIFVTTVQFNFLSNKPEKQLEQQAQKFYALFTLAAEYALLNNIELGILFTKNSYQFVGFDGSDWVAIPEQEQLRLIELPEEMQLTLKLDDLPLDDGPLLFDPKALMPEEDDFRAQEKPPTPQVFILSGGDISPFALTFAFDPTADIDFEPYYRVTGLYSLPITLEGPLTNDG
ncbi:type II secretion system minor pseudopilin GspH [Thalassotalea sp. LPB0316]|uniref:type II secretion system minor pseudopilin GspH n=1 Tax=Thalassotalea sp. LPB0316 TaxID=2769490 RepID=UPI001868E1BF|nr:type II secretion system minor pseudopilin GspH [Thalassotalea sp. LPB0316]QOL26591.1 type II secretion system minor pseudopilin GspH [Thalassotalea sp. LPB0316]